MKEPAPPLDLSVTARLIMNRLLGHHGKTGKVILISGAGLTTREASRHYDEAVKFLQENRGTIENAGKAWEALRDNEVKFKF